MFTGRVHPGWVCTVCLELINLCGGGEPRSNWNESVFSLEPGGLMLMDRTAAGQVSLSHTGWELKREKENFKSFSGRRPRRLFFKPPLRSLVNKAQPRSYEPVYPPPPPPPPTSPDLPREIR